MLCESNSGKVFGPSLSADLNIFLYPSGKKKKIRKIVLCHDNYKRSLKCIHNAERCSRHASERDAIQRVWTGLSGEPMPTS